MKKVWLSMVTILALSLASSCVKNFDEELQKNIERDKQLVRAYLERNGIDAIESQMGYFYRKLVTNESGQQIVNNDILGVYYEIKTIDGQLIESYLDESKRPRLYLHGDGGLVPRGINFASGIAKEGETLELYLPSNLAYGNYSFQQLIQPNSNLVVKVKFAKIFNQSKVDELEDTLAEEFIALKGYEGFEKTEEGLWKRTVKEGKEDGPIAENGKSVRFSFSLTQMDSDRPFDDAPNSLSTFTLRFGDQNNQKFLELALAGASVDQDMDVIVPSRLGFGATTQVFPYAIREDLLSKGLVPTFARPFEPLLFKVKIQAIN